MTENDTTGGLWRTFRRLDATVSKWGYSVSGWAGVFVGGIAMLAADWAAETVEYGLLGSLVAPLVWLAFVYGLLALAYTYRKRTGGPSCSI